MDIKDVHYIPAKILYNWDFNRYPVSKWASKFLFDTEFIRFYDLEVSQRKSKCQKNCVESLLFVSATQPKCVQSRRGTPIDAFVSFAIEIPTRIPSAVPNQTVFGEFKLSIFSLRFRANRLVFAERFSRDWRHAEKVAHDCQRWQKSHR